MTAAGASGTSTDHASGWSVPKRVREKACRVASPWLMPSKKTCHIRQQHHTARVRKKTCHMRQAI
jgi:hypothetical protein